MDAEAQQRLEQGAIEEWRREWAKNPEGAFSDRVYSLFCTVFADMRGHRPADVMSMAFGFQVGLGLAVAHPEWAAAIVAATEGQTKTKRMREVWEGTIRLMPVEAITEPPEEAQ